VYDHLTPDITAYRAQLERFASLEAKSIFENDNIAEFASFVLTNHWHYKKVFGGGLSESGISPSDVMQLQRAGNIFVEEYRKEKLCTIASTKKSLNNQIHEMLRKINNEQSEKAEI